MNIVIIVDLFLFLFLANSFISPYLLLAQPPQPVASHITILGSVYCDVCYDNTFSKHSYFLPGVDVNVECKLKASSPRTTEVISFSVNRSTDRYGMYKVDIPSVDGVDCTEDPTVQSSCQASLMVRAGAAAASLSACRVPSTRSTSTEITVKSKQTNACTYTLGALSYRPPVKNFTLCSNGNQRLITSSWNTSKFFLPYIPPYVFPPLPQLPPFPSFPFPPPNPNPPSLPFPFPPVPPPAFNFWDPTTWIPPSPPPRPHAP